MNRLFVVPNNDGEAVAIQELLKRNNEEFMVTQQGWEHHGLLLNLR